MLAIVILNYNTWDATEECIESICASDLDDYKIYIVDNASIIKAPKTIERYMVSREICFIQAKKNCGYAAGNNLGIREAVKDGCDYILITNNDVILNKEAVEGMRSFLKRHSEVGIIGPKIFLEGGKVQETNLGCKMTMLGKYLYILRKTPLAFFSKKFVNKFKIDITAEHWRYVYGVSGCCFMTPTNVFQKAEYFDEGTFLYEEENILGCKMDSLGYKVVWFPKASIIHKHGYSTKQYSAFAYQCLVESEIYYCKKYLQANIIQRFPLHFIRSCIYITRCFFLKDYRKNFKSYIKMLSEIW